MHAFISYSHSDRVIAASVKQCLNLVGISSFMAHEDISVSLKWAEKILEEIGKADIFLSLWSENYINSVWCLQESGIAEYRREMTKIPLSIDGKTVPLGAASYIQAKRVNQGSISISDLMPGLVRHNIQIGVNQLISSKSYREAEINFGLIFNEIDKLNNQEKIDLLEKISTNRQIYEAGDCATKYIPPIFENLKDKLSRNARNTLQEALRKYHDS